MGTLWRCAVVGFFYWVALLAALAAIYVPRDATYVVGYTLMRTGVALLASLISLVAFAQDQAPRPATDADEAAFQAFLSEVRGTALERGIRAETLDAVLPAIRIHRQAVQADRQQAEFVQTYEAYLRRVSPQRIERGKALMVEHGEMIRRVAADYDVQPRFIVAIIGLESNYGTYPIDEPLFDVVATLAFDGRRGAQFRAQLLAALEIVDKGYATPDQMKSSWAGALGVPQFTPTNVLEVAVDHDKDGRIDLWNVGPDVIASVAHYLQRTGWRADETWGREVALPAGGEETLAVPMADGATPPRVCRSYESLGAFRGLRDWQTLGVRSADGTDLPTRNLPAALDRRRRRRRSRLARLPQLLLADALQPGVPLRTLGRSSRRRDRQRELRRTLDGRSQSRLTPPWYRPRHGPTAGSTAAAAQPTLDARPGHLRRRTIHVRVGARRFRARARRRPAAERRRDRGARRSSFFTVCSRSASAISIRTSAITPSIGSRRSPASSCSGRCWPR